jgi:hypothetical protein
MSTTVEQIIDQKTLTLIESSDLVTLVEQRRLVV